MGLSATSSSSFPGVIEPVVVWWWDAQITNPLYCPLLPIYQLKGRDWHTTLWIAELVDVEGGPLIRTSESMYLPGWHWLLRAKVKYPEKTCGTWFNGQQCELIDPELAWDYYDNPDEWGRPGWMKRALAQVFPSGAPQRPLE